jgi:hypothetical protein
VYSPVSDRAGDEGSAKRRPLNLLSSFSFGKKISPRSGDDSNL